MKALIVFSSLVLSILSMTNSCDPNSDGHWDGKLTIVNNSTDTLLAFLQFNYPDTTLLDEDAPELNNTVIAPHSQEKIYSSILWEDRIMKLNSDQMIMIFINSYDTLAKYNWSEIQGDYNILKRYDLSISNLDSLNWTITYP